MPTQFRISGKHLGELNQVAYCPRCIWLKLRLEYRLPYQIFPGIFSSIDAYTKRVVQHFLDHDGLPKWLSELGDVSGYRPAPSYQTFCVDEPETNVHLTGAPDAILLNADGSHLIVDYKTSRYTRGQDALRPLYEGQLNAYAWIAERTGYRPVTRLALVYMQPRTALEDASDTTNHRPCGFAMAFTPHIEFVPIQRDLVPRLLMAAREIHDLPTPPPARRGCRDCAQAARAAALLQAGSA